MFSGLERSDRTLSRAIAGETHQVGEPASQTRLKIRVRKKMFSGLERSDKNQRWFWASAVLLVFLALGAAPYQHKSSHKLRATALVEVTTDPKGNVTIQVFPITILADGTFRDASIYESRPRPMALGNGVVYEAQKTGVPAGYVTIISGSNTPQGWVALGKWQSASQVEARANARPKPAPTSVALPDERPILHREGQNTQPAPTPTPAPGQTPSSPDDSDRPVLHRSTDSTPQATPSPTPTSSPSDDSDRPVLHRSTDSNPQATPTPTPSAAQPATQPEAEQPAPEDPNRPVLRHRKPGSDEAESVQPSVSSRSPASASSASSSSAPSPSSTAVPSRGTQTFLAVSDAQSSETRSYEFHWKAGEEEQIAAKMRKLALAQLPGEHAQTSEATLTNVVVRSFDLDLSNDAVVVITAEAPGGSLAPAGKAARGTSATKSAEKPAENPRIAENKSVLRYVIVIARVDIDGNPQKLAASVTDSSRLDVAPRLELVDAIDVEGTGVAALVFREYDFDQKSFIVYGVGHGTVTKLFEGASEPIK